MGDIIVAGSLNMDLSVCTQLMPEIGETVSGYDFQMLPGGKGLNQAYAAALLGSDVTMIGAVGEDEFGDSLIQFLKVGGIKTETIKKVKDIHTGSAIIVVYKGDNSIIIHEGANGSLSPEDIGKHKAMFHNSKVFITQFEIPMETVREALKMANENQVTTILNPSPMKPLDEDILKMVDVLMINFSECRAITGIEVSSLETAKTAIFCLVQKGISQIVITMGSDGVYFNDANEICHLPARKVTAVDTTGAGDTFTGAFATCTAKGLGIRETLNYAITASALTVTKRGAASSMPTGEEVERILGI